MEHPVGNREAAGSNPAVLTNTGECEMHGARPAVMDKRWRPGQPARVIKIKRGGTVGSSNSGPVGWKTRPSARLHRALAEAAAAGMRGRKR